MRDNALVPVKLIEQAIHVVRGQQVMLDADLAGFYEVDTKAVVRAVKRNLDSFPADFMFQLTKEEAEALRYQIGTSKMGRGGRRYLPYAFTEQGVAMVSSVLKSGRAVEVKIEIMRAFVRLRSILAVHHEIARRIEELERKYQTHDARFTAVFSALRKILAPKPRPEPRPDPRPRRSIGFTRPAKPPKP